MRTAGAAATPGSYRVAARELCEFAAKTGDLDHRFTPSPTGLQGIAGHKAVAARRAVGRRNEVSVSGTFGELLVRGRADGYYPDLGLLEEVKTYRGALERMPGNHRALHWAQAKTYGALLCAKLELNELDVSLVYFDVSTQEETTLVEHYSAADLKHFLETLCTSFLEWGIQELMHRRRRDEALRTLVFPHASYRPGQRQLAENVFMAARHGRCLMTQAPTGIGKTLATIFPLLKACATERLDKVFFLTAKGSGHQPAIDAISTLRRANGSMPLRVIELVSREKSCEHSDKACHGDSCPLAKGFYDRLPGARKAAMTSGVELSRATVRELASEHRVCPYYLTQELLRWADVVIADYNYVYDGTAILHLLTLANDWKVAHLVDEAHNLIERARSMYTTELREGDLARIARIAPAPLDRPLRRLMEAWADLTAGQRVAHVVLDVVPEPLVSGLSAVVAAFGDLLAETPDAIDVELLHFYFDALQFQRLLESCGDYSIVDSTLDPSLRGGTSTSTLCVRNVVPANFLRPRYAAAVTTVAFSATLAPRRFYADMLGLPSDTAWLDVEAPFDASQLQVRVVTSVATRFAVRKASVRPIARLIAAQYREKPGNYLAFFSSFDYLEDAAGAFAGLSPRVPRWVQGRRQNESEREAFLDRFEPDGCGVGFAVLGGSFGEGIDLPGSRLIGAFIATLGLPQVNPVNDAIKARLESMFGAGYDYAYLYPGLRKVVQAAGRVIRSPEDRGVVYLIDDRFDDERVQALLPRWWLARRGNSDGSGHFADSGGLLASPSSTTFQSAADIVDSQLS